MAFVDVERARRLMEARELDALAAFTHANVYYLSGFLNYFFKPGAAAVLLPADPGRAPAMIISSWEEVPARRHSAIQDIRTFPLWMEIDTLEELERGGKSRIEKPVQFDLEGNVRQFAEIIGERKLERGRIGVELGAMSHQLVELVRRYCPHATLVEAEDLYYELRAIKAPGEIELMRHATALTERGIQAIAESGLVGATVSKLRFTYQTAIAQEALRHPAFAGLSGFRVTTSVGGDFAPKAVADQTRAAPGDMIFFDCSAYLSAYASDTGRTFTLGPAKPLPRRVMNALCAGIQEGLAIAKPGLPFAELFGRMLGVIRAAGLPSFTRGHLGHTIGITLGPLAEEQPPWVAASETAVLEPGMVFCIETPYYVHGLGGFQLEEVLEVTATNCRRLTTLPMDFWEVPV